MTEVQRKYLEWVGFNDYEIQEVETEIKNGEEIFVFEGFQFYAWESGYNKANEWHKVSEQLPTEEKDYLVKLIDGTIDVMAIALDGNLEPYLLTPKLDFYKDVEKWCEIPKESE